jgi:hypothetical protein
MGSQELSINRKKSNFRKKKKITRKSITHQPTYVRVSTDKKPVSDKKVRREEKKKQIKLQKKQAKAQKR